MTRIPKSALVRTSSDTSIGQRLTKPKRPVDNGVQRRADLDEDGTDCPDDGDCVGLSCLKVSGLEGALLLLSAGRHGVLGFWDHGCDLRDGIMDGGCCMVQRRDVGVRGEPGKPKSGKVRSRGRDSHVDKAVKFCQYHWAKNFLWRNFLSCDLSGEEGDASGWMGISAKSSRRKSQNQDARASARALEPRNDDDVLDV